MPFRDAKGIVTMITTCPACYTAFRVTQEQLAAREGMVRCGKCATVFDAREALQPAARAAPSFIAAIANIP